MSTNFRDIEVTAQVAADHGLTPDEWAKVLEILGRTPTIEELGVFSVMWSEHCSYKSSRPFLKDLPTEGPRVLQGPGENAGAIDIGDGIAAVFKIESHNHPSFIEPKQGAATGVGGILRDVFTMGARPIANLNSLRFGSIDHPKTPHLVRGVVAGVGGYGNCVGVPTVGGEVYFDAGYDQNILVNAFTLGVVKSDGIFRAKAAGVGNPVIYLGSRTGRDGIHGASLLASAEFDETSEQKRPTVQVGDPFTEKLLLEACLELMETDAIVAIQDMGAAGLTSSSVEMASRGGVGIELDMDLIPRREEGMTPYEILLSESQERMLLVAKAGREEEVARIFDKWDLEAAVVGRVTDDGLFRVLDQGKVVVSIPAGDVADEAPVAIREVREPEDIQELQAFDPSTLPVPQDLGGTLLQLLGSPNLSSRQWIYNQYDHYVRGNTVIHPGGDAAVVRVPGTRKGIALTVDCNSRYCSLDPYLGALIAVAEAARNLVVTGAEPLGITDCLNFGSPEKPEVMWQFQQAIAGIRDASIAFGTPVVSGNVSFYNETHGNSIPPTPTIGMIGLIGDLGERIGAGFRQAGDKILLAGTSRDELGGSEFLSTIHGIVAGTPPWIDLTDEKTLQKFILRLASEGLLRSAHDVSEGGLAVAVAECCLLAERSVGARFAAETGLRIDAALFGESQSRVVLSCDGHDFERISEIADDLDVPLSTLGEVRRSPRFEVTGHIDVPVAELRDAWANSLERQIGSL